ncbi:MAG: insulinase family protein [bacterium]
MLARICFVILIFFNFIVQFAYSVQEAIEEEYLKKFDIAWERFIHSNAFIITCNSYVSIINLIYPIGLSDESSNKVGVRYVFFYLLYSGIKDILETNDLVCKVNFEVENDYGVISIVIPPQYSVEKIIGLIRDFATKPSFKPDYQLDYNTLYVISNDISEYYTNTFNSILLYFRQNIFSAHPYSFLSLGNPSNIKHITIQDINDLLSRVNLEVIFFIALGFNQNEIALRKIFGYNSHKNFRFNNFRDRYYYREVEITKNRTFSLPIRSESSYFLYLFTAPEFDRNFEDYLAMLVIDNILTDTMDGILWRELRENQGMVYSIYSQYPILRYTSYYILFTSCYYKNQTEVRKRMNKILGSLELSIDVISYSKQKLCSRGYLNLISPKEFADSMVYCLLYRDKRISPFYISRYISLLEPTRIKAVYDKYFSRYYVFIFEGG